jgi:hypothetical protein
LYAEEWVPEVTRYLQNTLAVHQYQTNITFLRYQKCSSVAIPADDQKNGMPADMVFYVTNTYKTCLYGETFVCFLDSQYQNPMAAHRVLNKAKIEALKLKQLHQVVLNLFTKGLGSVSFLSMYPGGRMARFILSLN